MSVVRLRPLGIGEMLDAAFKVYRSRPRDMVVASAIVTFPAVVLQVLVQLSAGDPQALTETDPASGLPTIDGAAFAVYLGGLLVTTAILLAANNIALAGTTRMSLGAYLGQPTTWKESLRFAFRRIGSLTGLLAITTIGLIGGFLLCVVPAFWIQGIWAVVVPAMLLEDLGVIGSLKRSQQLVSGRFWPVLGAMVLGGLLASVLQGILVAPVMVLQFVEAPFLVTSLLSGVAQFIGVALTTPFVAALTAVVYIDLRVRKEAFDLQLLATGIGVDPSTVDAQSGSGPLVGSAVVNQLEPWPVGPGGVSGPGGPWVAQPPSGGGFGPSEPAGPVAPPGGWRAPGQQWPPGPPDQV